MVIVLKRLIEWFVLFIFFFLIVVILYQVIFFINERIQYPIEKYKQPTGHSIKVVEMKDRGRSNIRADFIERIKFYYWLGE